MTSPGNSLFSGSAPDNSMAILLDAGLDSQDEVLTPFAEPQRPPQPPRDPSSANALIASALRDGNPEGDSLPREDGAPVRD